MKDYMDMNPLVIQKGEDVILLIRQAIDTLIVYHRCGVLVHGHGKKSW